MNTTNYQGKVMPKALELAKNMAILGNNRTAYEGIKMSMYRDYIKITESSERDIYSRMAMMKFRQNL